uniref:Guanine nucleotide-binding protein subunit beta-like protein n=1 Tax=Palpitomonas bilix TaxID=652834 RepID=A0A7S3G0Q8_9EUKA
MGRRGGGSALHPTVLPIYDRDGSDESDGGGMGGGGGGGGGKTAAAGALKRYDDCSDPPSILKKDRSSPIHTKAITELCLLSDGSRLATAGMDNNAAVAKLPLPKGGTDGAHYAGHTAPVLAVSLSQDCDDPLLISTSADGTARLWRAKPPSVGSGNPGVAKNPKKSSDPLLLQLDSPAGNMKAAASAKKFGAEISAGRFFYLDKFLLLGYSGKVQVVKYHIEAEENLNDIERLRRHNNRYKSVAKLDLESQYTTAVGCVNSFSSPIVFAAGSNRCLKVFDMAVCKCAHTFEDAHAKAVHTIAVNEVSPFVTLPLSAYDVFVTSAADGCVKLWDLRSRMSVGRFEEHTNRVHKIGASLSPCMRFLASGSEDKVAHIYDLRKGTTLHRLHGHTQCVSDVAFHPLHSHLYTSSFDGTVRVYVDK